MVLNVKRPLFLLNPPTPETEIFVVVDILVKKCRNTTLSTPIVNWSSHNMYGVSACLPTGPNETAHHSQMRVFAICRWPSTWSFFRPTDGPLLVPKGRGTSHKRILATSGPILPSRCHLVIFGPGGEERLYLFGHRSRLNHPLSRLDIDT